MDHTKGDLAKTKFTKIHSAFLCHGNLYFCWKYITDDISSLIDTFDL